MNIVGGSVTIWLEYLFGHLVRQLKIAQSYKNLTKFQNNAEK